MQRAKMSARVIPMRLIQLELGPGWTVVQNADGSTSISASEDAVVRLADALSAVYWTGDKCNEHVNRIQRIVALKFNLTVAQLKSRKRPQKLAWPRQLAMYLVRKYGAGGEIEMSFPQVAEVFKRSDGSVPDHGTVMYACDIVNARRKVGEVAKQLEILEAAIKGDDVT